MSHRRQDADHWDDQRRHRNFADPLARKTGFLATNEVPIFGLSYTSTDGVTFNQNATFNFRFSLVLSTPPHAVRERRKG